MRAPCRSQWDTVFDGFELEIHIVDHCNLNCAGCNHFSPLAEPTFISKEDFTNQLKIVAERLPSIKRLMILGGEPCLHPELKDLLLIARTIFSNLEINIDVLTNGSLLDVILKDATLYQENHIHFLISRYKNLKYNEEKLKQIKKLNIGGDNVTRPIFLQTLVDVSGSQDQEKAFNYNCQVKKPCLTLKDYKIYECPFAAHYHIFSNCFNLENPIIKEDYLDLNTITLEKLEEFCYKPKNICRYCRQGNTWFWHPSEKNFSEYTKTLKELYFFDYEQYLKIININYFKEENENFLTNRDENFSLAYYEKQKKRFGFGKIDLIIPYYNTSIECINLLYDSIVHLKDIENVVIYLISDASEKQIDEYVWNKFSENNKLNCVFLKNLVNQGPGVTRNLGIENSYNNILYFLDADDYFINKDIMLLVQKDIENKNSLNIKKNDKRPFLKTGSVYDIAVKRDFLNQYNIKYLPTYCHEDAYFFEQINCFNQGFNQIPNYFGSVYTNNCKNSICHTIPTDIAAFNYIFEKYLIIYKIKNSYNKNFQKNLFYNFLNINRNLETYLHFFKNNLNDFKFYIVSAFYVLYKMYQEFNLIDLNSFSYTKEEKYWLNRIFKKDFYFKINEDLILEKEKDVCKYIKDTILERFDLNNPYISSIYKLLLMEEIFNDL